MKIDKKEHKFGFKGLCLEFGDAEKVTGEDFDSLPDAIGQDDRLVFRALSLRHTVRIQGYLPESDML